MLMPDAADHHPTDDMLAGEGRKHYRLLVIGVVALLALACAYPFSLNLVDPDLWGHVRYGQDWLEAGELPRTATHTYTAIGHPWVNHENAAELLFALSYQHIGVYGMLVGKCLLGMAIMSTMAWLAYRQGVPAISAWALLLLVATNLHAFFPMRPQLLSFALCSISLVCLDAAFPRWPEQRVVRFRWLLPLPMVFVAWVNSHGGFVAGLCIVGAVLLGRMIELMVRDRDAPWGKVIGIAAVGLGCVAATLVNPYGIGMHQWLWHAWGGAPPEITEWAPPRPHMPVFWPFVALAAAAAGSLWASQRKRDWVQIIVFALVTWQASLHLRHIAFVAILCGFWLPVHWHSAIRRLRPDRDKPLEPMRPSRWLQGAMAAGILLGITVQSTTLARRLSDFPVLRSHYPVDAFQYMVDNRLGGKLACAFNWAQYALAALSPECTVGFDGRFDTCYPQEAIDVHFDFLLGGSGPRDRRSAVMQAESAKKHPEWSLLYSDSVAELWGRVDRYDDPASPHYLAPERRRLDVKLLEARFQWPAFPDRSLWEEGHAAAHIPSPQQERTLITASPR
jgi:hypothetical protein